MRAAAIAAALAVAACGSARRSIPVIGEREIPNETIARGEVAFHRACNPCHPGGTSGLGPAINNKPLPAAAITFQIREGLGEMPAFSTEELSDADAEAIAAYLIWLRELPDP